MSYCGEVKAYMKAAIRAGNFDIDKIRDVLSSFLPKVNETEFKVADYIRWDNTRQIVKCKADAAQAIIVGFQVDDDSPIVNKRLPNEETNVFYLLDQNKATPGSIHKCRKCPL